MDIEPDPGLAFALADELGLALTDDDADVVDERDDCAAPCDVAAEAMPAPPAPRLAATTPVMASRRGR